MDTSGPLVVALVFVVVPVAAAVATAVAGRLVERRHLTDLEQREAAVAHLPASNLRGPTGARPGVGTLVSGSVVLGVDLAKMFVLGIVNLIGGDAPQVSRVMARARREALVRLKEQAVGLGASEVVNVRFGTSTISTRQGRQGVASTEIFCTGTAIVPGP